ncbi:MAG: SurA N-terminal domain-containing protein [Desulfovibrio sp.]|nr:SurA N-terminal domain-containing protein [Desulfovibrio sp.]
MMLFTRVLVWLVCLFSAGCLQARLPEGVVATVNGEPIYLRTVQALLDGRTSASGAWETPSLKIMKTRYGDALGTLIVSALVRQELARRKIAVSDGDMEKALAEMRADYGREEFSRIFADESLNETEWRNLLRDHLSMQRFEKNILLPGIKIDLPAVRAYYQEYAADFSLPETLNVCFATAERKEDLEAYRDAFPNAAMAPPHGTSEQCQNILPQDLPPEWQKRLGNLAERACAVSVARGPVWETICLKQRLVAGSVGVAEAYALIERQLLEKEKLAAFRRWLEVSLALADIRVSPHMRDDLLSPRRADMVPVAGPLPPRDEDEGHETEPVAN